MSLHLRAIARDQKITPRFEQILAVNPGRTDQRNSAGKGFERANCRNSSQYLYVRPARNMNGYFITRENFRNAVIRYPATVFDAGSSQQFLRILRIPYTEDLAA